VYEVEPVVVVLTPRLTREDQMCLAGLGIELHDRILVVDVSGPRQIAGLRKGSSIRRLGQGDVVEDRSGRVGVRSVD
jgi:hypothetical protein